MPYTHFTLNERKYLQQLLSEGYSFRKIAAILDRSPSSVSREVKRNRAKYKPHHKPDNKHWYNHWRAQNLYIRRRRESGCRRFRPGDTEWEYIVSALERFWSPEMLCGRWNKEHPTGKKLHFSTVYRYINRGDFPKITAKKHLRRRGKHFMPRTSCYNTIQTDRLIPQWPDEIRNRQRIGDWEGDTVYGGIGKGLLVTLVDRKSRFLRMGLLRSRNANDTRDVIVQLLGGFPVKASVWTTVRSSRSSGR